MIAYVVVAVIVGVLSCVNPLRSLPPSLCPQIKLEDAEQKKTVAEGIAETVSKEKAIVEVETAKAQVQAEQVAKTQAEVSTYGPVYRRS